MEQIISSTPILLLILAWTLPWKGLALWKAAKNHQKKWFVALLVFNTLAILEIMKKTGYDAAGLSADDTEAGYAAMSKLAEKSGFRIIVSNVRAKQKKITDGFILTDAPSPEKFCSIPMVPPTLKDLDMFPARTRFYGKMR